MVPIFEEDQSRVGEYFERAATLRGLAAETRYPEVRQRLLGLAAAFERLADVEKWERASRGGGLGNSRTLGMKVRSAAQRVARDMVGRYGRDAPRILRERAASAEEYGDDSEAAAWREIADIAERISERR